MAEPFVRTLDRSHGADAYAKAVQQLRQGELVALHPEATISRSYELRDFKTGAARMALEARVPLVPMVVWGAHRIWTKDHPKKIFLNKIPITVAVGRALLPKGNFESLNAALRQAMNSLLYRVQEEYPHPPGAVLGAPPTGWHRAVPGRPGGPALGRTPGAGSKKRGAPPVTPASGEGRSSQ